MRSFAAHAASAAVAGSTLGADRRRPRPIHRRARAVHALRTAGALTRLSPQSAAAYLLTASRTPSPTKTAPAARFSATPAEARPRRRALIAAAERTSTRHQSVPLMMNTAPRKKRKHARFGARVHELGQERHEEQRDFRVQHVGQKPRPVDRPGRLALEMRTAGRRDVPATHCGRRCRACPDRT